MGSVSLKTISQKCGVAISTVSAVLNDNPSCYSSGAVKQLIKKTARELNYRPDFFARGLRTKKSHTIGIIAPNLQIHTTIANIELIENLAWEKGYHLFIGYSQNDTKKEEVLIEEFIRRHVDGVILIAGYISEKENNSLKKLTSENLPTVVVGRMEGQEISSVSTDYYQGGQLAAEHLLGLGHEKIGIISYATGYPSVKERLRGFLDTLRKRKLKPVKTIDFAEDYTVLTQIEIMEKSYFLAEQLLGGKNRPSAIFAITDEVALGVAKKAFELGLKIPEEISLIGFDDSAAASFSFIPITTVKQKREEISKAAFEMLREKIEGKANKATKRTITPELIVRASTSKFQGSSGERRLSLSPPCFLPLSR